MSFDPGLKAHLATGVTTLCHAWRLDRADGGVLGFTDHDEALEFEGVTFRADSGLSAMALQQGTGLAVDNSEAMGALKDAAIRDVDIEAGLYDGAELTAWLVNWADPGARQVIFRGSIGEIRRAGGAFHAELRGQTEALNRPMGRVFQPACSAVLGDADCGVDLSQPGYVLEGAVHLVDEHDGVSIENVAGFDPGWFDRGRFEVLSGKATGSVTAIKQDQPEGAFRRIALWQMPRAGLATGDEVRLVAGCDKRFETCRLKFVNALNFRGFPDIPGDDWQVAVPARSGALGGGSRR